MPTYRYLDDKHEYWCDYEDGHSERFPSVTEIINSAGLISEFSKQEFAAMRGSMVHLAARYYLEGRLDFSSLDHRMLPYIQSLETWVKITGFVSEACENRLYHPLLRYAGTYDCKGYLPNGERLLLDWKSGVKEAWHGIQLGGYMILEGGYRRRGCVYLKGDGDIAEFESYDDPMDMVNFISLLNCYRIKEECK